MNKFDVIARVDLPAGAVIVCSKELHTAILQGLVKGEIVKEGGEYVLQAKRVATGSTSEIGPTGTFPKGKICPEDEGELAIGMSIDPEKKIIVIEFGKPVAWLGLHVEEATQIADDLLNKVNKLSELENKES